MSPNEKFHALITAGLGTCRRQLPSTSQTSGVPSSACTSDGAGGIATSSGIDEICASESGSSCQNVSSFHAAKLSGFVTCRRTPVGTVAAQVMLIGLPESSLFVPPALSIA